MIQLNVTIQRFPLRFMSFLYTNFVNQLKPCRPRALQCVRVNTMALITGIIVSYLLPIPSLHEAIYVLHARGYDPEALLYRRFCIFGMSLYLGYADRIWQLMQKSHYFLYSYSTFCVASTLLDSLVHFPSLEHHSPNIRLQEKIPLHQNVTTIYSPQGWAPRFIA